MSRVLVLGAGRQGRAALLDLAANPLVHEIVAADQDLSPLRELVARAGLESRVGLRNLDAADPRALDRLVGEGFAVVLSLLPVALHDLAAASAVAHGAHLVTSSYPSPHLRRLHEDARSRGLALLPEMGLDPGLDLVLMAEAVGRFDRLEWLHSYAAGFPEAEAAGTPLRYKTTWTFEGVLRSYRRAGRVVREGRVVEIAADAMFAEQHLHQLEIPGVGRLEAFPNGDTLHYLELLGVAPVSLRSAGRFVLRWPGHAAFWRPLIELGLLDDESVEVDGVAVDRRRFLAAALAPHLVYGADERDVAVVRIDARGRREGVPAEVLLELVDRRDLATGLFAMNRTVGFTAAIGVSMLLDGTISARGLLSPALHVPYERLVQELGKRGIKVVDRDM